MGGHILVTNFLIILLTSSCMCISSNKFTRERNIKLNDVFYSLDVKSSVQCCVQCRENSFCTAVNYSPDSKICELNNDKSSNVFPNTMPSTTRSIDIFILDSGWETINLKSLSQALIEYTLVIGGACEDPWVLFGSHCYRLISTMTDWQTSEAQCSELNSHLVDIQNEDENTFVREMADSGELPGQEIWIGMYIEEVSRHRSWTAGNLVAYQNFASGEPGSHENCVEMWSQKKWNDSTCARLMMSVCKKPAQ